MTLTKCPLYILVTSVSLAGVGMWLVAPTRAQGGTSSDWPSHNLDLRNSRHSPLDQINTSNASRLTQQWSIQTSGADAIPQVTPLVVDGVMYYNAGSKLVALNAATGATLWTHEIDPPFPGVGRGPTYADGRIYAYGGTYGSNVLYVVDAKTGQPLPSFGSKGRLLVADEVVKFKYPQKDAAGYRLVGPPAYLKGMLYVGLANSERHIPGGLSARFPRRRQMTGGRWQKTPGSAGSESAVASGLSQPSMPSWG
jgi:quinoprotein glucose dehydrogenase